MNLYHEIAIRAQADVDPFARGSSVRLRVIVGHYRKGCEWEVAFPSAPTSEVPWCLVAKEVAEHRRTCPLLPPEPRTSDALRLIVEQTGLDPDDLTREARKILDLPLDPR